MRRLGQEGGRAFQAEGVTCQLHGGMTEQACHKTVKMYNAWGWGWVCLEKQNPERWIGASLGSAFYAY